jgi:hypothetical protein
MFALIWCLHNPLDDSSNDYGPPSHYKDRRLTSMDVRDFDPQTTAVPLSKLTRSDSGHASTSEARLYSSRLPGFDT